MACAEEKFKLLLMFPQMYDSSVEYLRSDKGRFVVQTEAAGEYIHVHASMCVGLHTYMYVHACVCVLFCAY